MKITRFDMEDWLIEHVSADFNLGESGCQDYSLSELFALCRTDLAELGSLTLGNNDTRGSLALREEIRRCYDTVSVSEVLAANGSSEAIFAFVNEVLEPGDEVVVHFPAFQCLYEVPRAIGCELRFLRLDECEGYRLDVDKLDDLVTERTQLIIINNPHNPFGWTLSVDELARIGEIARRANAYLLFDEHYRYLPLTDGVELISSGYDVCKELHDKTYATGSMIKCLGIVGIRIGWLLGESSVLDRCRDYKDYLTHTIPSVTDYIATLSLRHRDTIIVEKKKDILPNLALLDEVMARHRQLFDYVRPTGGVVCFPRLRADVDTRRFCQDLVEQHRVALLPGFAFGMDHHVRLNFGIDRQRFAEAMGRLEQHIRSIGSS